MHTSARSALAIALTALLASITAAQSSEPPADAPPLPVRAIPAASFAPPAVVPAGQLSDRVVAYTIKATLDPADGAKSVTGTETIGWRNPSDVAVGELQFHLYLNAFRDASSTFMRESGGQLRGDRMDEKRLGSIEVTSLKLADGTDLLPALEFIQPDDGNADDRTVARVPLPSPVPPGGAVSVDVAFVSKLPRVFARTGYKDNFFMVAQWYPKLGVFEPRGVRGRAEPGWNCHQFHANSEFYADFGTFDVEVTTPARFVVGATGALAGERREGDSVTRRFVQADVHDFAWTADDTYVVGTRRFADPGFPEVQITALVQAEHGALLDRHLDACEASLRWFDTHVGPYPYATLTVVDPEEGGGGAGGMEYPTLITAGFLAMSEGALPADDDPTLELVIFHEFGHQYWYGMVANNEFEEPWLDEGINSYTELVGLEDIWPDKRALHVQYGGANVARFPFPYPVAGRMMRFAAVQQVVRAGPLINTSWGFKGSYQYGVNTYYRTAVTLRTLQGVLGRETMDRVIRAYFERWRFRHPTSQDFFDVAEEVSGRDLTPFFTQFFRQARVLDYAVASVSGGTEGQPEKVLLERRGDAILPVAAVVTRDDGSVEELAWDGVDTYREFELAAGARVARVEIDPGREIWLDANVTNNSWRSDRAVAGPARVASQWALALQHVLVFLSGAL